MIEYKDIAKVLTYDLETGELRRKSTGEIPGNLHKSGKNQYRRIWLGERKYYAHRLIWILHYKSEPKGDIDHIDGDGLNNRIENLRDVSHKTNCKNQRLRESNTSGCAGVSWAKNMKKWQAYIILDGVKKNLGHYFEFIDAVGARQAAELKYGFISRGLA